jgi:hypothetical protein
LAVYDIFIPLFFSVYAVNRAGSTPPALPACPWIAIFALPGIPCRPSHAGSRFSSPPASQNDGQPVVLQRELILFVALVALDGGNPLGIGNDDSNGGRLKNIPDGNPILAGPLYTDIFAVVLYESLL